MDSVLEVVASQDREFRAIGTLNEGALHAQLKDWYRRRGDRVEQVVDGFVVDLIRGNLLVEIQTGSFAPLRRKLELLTRQHRVRLVAPVPLVRTITRLSDEGEPLSARRSPRRGRIEDIFNRLVSIPWLLCRPHFELELILTHQDELRVYRQGQAFRRHGWVVAGRQLVSVEKCVHIACPDDAARLLPPGLPELFDTAQLAEAAAIERRSPSRWPTACEQSASSRGQANAATPSSTAASRHRGSPEGVDGTRAPAPLCRRFSLDG